ncbi:MAG: DUF952 domain-containing protein [Chloroflexi bacterium]|nr:DUF952 domain-containing protein [Chloroflexota bacterium]
MAVIYHLAPAARWVAWPDGVPYLPAEFATEGFIHCTAGDNLMLRIANRFYRNTPGDFVLLVLDSEKLTAPVRWERADIAEVEFPHIYGPIDQTAITEVRTVQRDPDGTFVGW